MVEYVIPPCAYDRKQKTGLKIWSGWDKYQIVYYTSDSKITIHFVYDPKNHLFDDFKFVFPK